LFVYAEKSCQFITKGVIKDFKFCGELEFVEDELGMKWGEGKRVDVN
jgi:hypothetical protein